MKKSLFRVILLIMTLSLLLTACESHTHTYGAWSVDYEATCTEEGREIRKCECGAKETKSIPAKKHIGGEWVIDAEPTHTEAGSKRQVCPVCDATISTQSIPALGFEDSDLYEVYYVDPATVDITANGQTKNLIYIYLESMETSFMSKDNGGTQNGVNYIPNLTQLAKDNVSFSNKSDGQLGGFYTFEGATSWTMGALFALTSGLPFNFPVEPNAMGSQEYFAPGITTIGDILEDRGYNSVFLCGSNASFGGRKKYFTQHGSYLIYDLYTARRNGDLPTSNYDNEFWGFEDIYLYQIAKKELTRLAAENAPFNMTLLTVDTHFPKGYQCSVCGDTYDRDATYDGNMRNVLLCADHQVMEFVKWCQEQDFYEDTVIVISGDHPFMSVNAEMVKGQAMNDRTVYNCIINSAVEAPAGTTSNRLFTSMDMFPTTLAAMGFDIEGNRLGMGVNLFSGQKTVMEQTGHKVFAEEVIKKSDYYNEFTGFNAVNNAGS